MKITENLWNTAMIRLWYGHDTVMIRSWYGHDTVPRSPKLLLLSTLWSRLYIGIAPELSHFGWPPWYGHDTVMIRSWYGHDTVEGFQGFPGISGDLKGFWWISADFEEFQGILMDFEGFQGFSGILGDFEGSWRISRDFERYGRYTVDIQSIY